MNRYYIAAELVLNAESEAEAQRIVTGYLDGFPNEADTRDPIVIVADAILVSADVEAET